jgi:hypothetical protein
MGPGEVRRVERWLATARLALAISALFAIWMDPAHISWWAHWLLGIYIIHGTVVMFLLRFRKQSTPAFRSVVHAADLVWPALISAFATGTGNPFFLFFMPGTPRVGGCLSAPPQLAEVGLHGKLLFDLVARLRSKHPRSLIKLGAGQRSPESKRSRRFESPNHKYIPILQEGCRMSRAACFGGCSGQE